MGTPANLNRHSNRAAVRETVFRIFLGTNAFLTTNAFQGFSKSLWKKPRRRVCSNEYQPYWDKNRSGRREGRLRGETKNRLHRRLTQTLFGVVVCISCSFERNLFYNNCLICRALIGSFLSSIRVQTHKILI